MIERVLRCMIVAADLPGGGMAVAASPTFDCAKANGSIEKLIFRDDALAALDVRLDKAFKQALAKSKSDSEGLRRPISVRCSAARSSCATPRCRP
jgi:uncharacterized protein